MKKKKGADKVSMSEKSSGEGKEVDYTNMEFSIIRKKLLFHIPNLASKLKIDLINHKAFSDKSEIFEEPEKLEKKRLGSSKDDSSKHSGT